MPERFSNQLRGHLTHGGYALVVLSTDGEPHAFLEAFQRNGLQCTVVARRDFVNEVMTIYKVQAAC
jgi:hypothetical protein